MEVEMGSEDTAMDAWEYARSQGKSLLQTAPANFKMVSEGDVISINCTMTTRQEMRAVCAILQHLGEPWLPDAEAIEAAKDDAPKGD